MMSHEEYLNQPILRNCIVCNKPFRLAKREVKRCARCVRLSKEILK